MATNDETFMLVEKARIAGAGTTPGETQPIEIITSVIRTYLSRGRADDDLTLMNQMLPERRFEVMTTEFIDS